MNDDAFIKIERSEPLSKKVEKQITNAILKKIFLPGDKLPSEMELSEKFGVSRTAVREALRMLSGRGLVDIRKGSGIYVSEIDMNNVVDPFYQLLEIKCGERSLLHLLRVRCFMEPEIARLCALHRSDEDIVFLEHNYAEMEKLAKKPEKMIDRDIQFHRRLAGATENPIIPIIMEPIFQLLYRFISSTYRQSHAPDLALSYHKKLLECMKVKDAEGAHDVMKNHMLSAEGHVQQYYQSIGFHDF